MGLMQNLFVIYLFISIGFFLTTIPGSGIDLGMDDNKLIGFVNARFFFDPDVVDPATGQTTVDLNQSGGFLQTLPKTKGEGGVSLGTGLRFITDGLGLMFAFILLLINMITMPLQLLLSVSGMPVELIYFIAVPMGLMMVLGIIFMIRGFKG